MLYSQLPHWKQPIMFMEDDDGTGGSGGGKSGGGQEGDPGTGGNEGGAGGGDWRESLPEDVRGWDEVKNSDSPEKFWHQITHMRSRMGQSIRIPSNEAGKEDWQEFYRKINTKVPGVVPLPDPDNEEATKAFYSRMGVPEKPDKYAPPEFENTDSLDTSPIDAFKPIAHKHGLTQKQFEGIVKDMTENNLKAAQDRKTTADQHMKELSDEWGAAFDKNMRFIQNVVQKTGAPEALLNAIVQGRIDAPSARWLLDIGKALGGEKTIMARDNSKNEGVMTPAEAKERIAEIYSNRDHAYWDRRNPGHQDAVNRMVELQKLANPDASDSVDELRTGFRGAV